MSLYSNFWWNFTQKWVKKHILYNTKTQRSCFFRFSFRATLFSLKVPFLGLFYPFLGKISSKIWIQWHLKPFPHIRTAPLYLRRYGIYLFLFNSISDIGIYKSKLKFDIGKCYFNFYFTNNKYGFSLKFALPINIIPKKELSFHLRYF